MRRSVLLIVPMAAVLVVPIPSAWASWASTGAGTGAGTVGTLAAPTAVTVPATSASTVHVTWTASSGSPAPTGYTVIRTRTSDSAVAAACGGGTIAAASCDDTFVPVASYRYTVTAVYRTWTAASAASGIVTINPPTKLGFTTAPSGGTGGVALGTQPVVAVQDASGNTVTTATNAVTLALTTPAGATLSCTSNPASAAAGLATFAGCAVNKTGSYTLTATSGSLTSAVSASFTITVGAAALLAFTTSPSAATGGIAFAAQPTVAVQDAGGNATTATNSITLALTTPAGATLSCTGGLSRAAVSGSATFVGCAVDKIGSYTLTATSGSLTSAVSSSFTITVGAAAKLGFTTAPSAGTGGLVLATQPVVAVQDAGGNTVTGAVNSVTLTLTTPAGATLTCTANPKAAVAGLATFAGCKVNKTGTYTLTAAATGLTSGVSASFAITVGVAAGMILTSATNNNGSIVPTCSGSGATWVCDALGSTTGLSRPLTATVTLVDAGGNVATNAGAAITVSLSTSTLLASVSVSSVTIAGGASNSTTQFTLNMPPTVLFISPSANYTATATVNGSAATLTGTAS